MKTTRIISIIATILFGIGVCIVLYPSVSNWLNEKNSSKVSAGYEDAVSELTETDYSCILQEAEAHNELLRQAGSLGSAVYMENKDHQETYKDLLNVAENGVMGTIRIPKIHVTLPIYHTTDDAVIQIAVGHYVGSSLPVGGEGTHCILSGHRGLPSAELFTRLDQMEEGDQFFIDVLGKTLAYQVDKIDTVLPGIQHALDIVPGEDYVTLVTCTPYTINTHRLLVRGTRVPYVPEIEKEEVEKAREQAAIQVKSETGKRMIYLMIFAVVAFGTAHFAGIRAGEKYRQSKK